MVGTVARTLTEILDNPIVKAASNRSNPVKPVIREALKDWRIDLDRRNPASIYTSSDDGEPIYRGTDFDLFTLLMALTERRAVINIPSYGTLRASVLTSNQRLIAKENRHGQALRLISSEDANSMSILVKDFNVVETTPSGREIVGVPRNFALVDYYGNWHNEWGQIEFRATKEEREFFEKHELLTFEDTLRFQNFVHPNLAFAFFGSRYLAMKAIGQRIKEQGNYYRGIASTIRGMLRERGIDVPKPSYDVVSSRERGIALPSGSTYEKPTYEPVGESKKILVKTIEAKLILPPFIGVYPLHSLDEDGKVHIDNGRYTFQLPKDDTKALKGILRYVEKVADEISYGATGFLVRAPIRAVEHAFFRNGFIKGHRLEPGYEIRPGWDIPVWTRDFQETENGRRLPTRWNALKLNDYARSLYRVKQTTKDIKQELELDEQVRRYEGGELVLV